MLDDDYRPYLMSFGKNRNEYINAVMIPVSIIYRRGCVLTNVGLFMTSFIIVILKVEPSLDYIVPLSFYMFYVAFLVSDGYFDHCRYS